jgi:3-oxoadipate enol-lactonase
VTSATDRSQGYALVNGARLYYERAGAGAPVILAHGFTLDQRMWDPQWDALAQSFDVARYDARGYGRSSLPDGAFSRVDDLAGLLDFFGWERAHLVGLSMGGGLVLDFLLTHPERVRSIVLIDAPLGGFTASPEVEAWFANIWRAARERGADAGRQAWLACPFFVPAYEQHPVAAALDEMVRDYSCWHFFNDDPDAGITPSAAERLHEVRVPALVIVGEREVDHFRVMAESMAERIRGARLSVIPHAGHMANMEAPAAVNRELLAFLAQSEV